MRAVHRLMTVAREIGEVRDAVVACVLFVVALAADLSSAPPALVAVLYLGCYAGGIRKAVAGIDALRERRLDVDLLMVVAALAAAAIGQWQDGALLILIFATSSALEQLAVRRTGRSVADLLEITPDEAELLRPDGTAVQVAARDLQRGDRVLVRPGQRIPGDGVVQAGTSEVDQAAVTGEPLPANKSPGDRVFAGTTNGTGALTVRVDRAAAESVIARVAALVEEATASKAPTQLFIERVEQRYSVGVVACTLLLLALGPLLAGWDGRQTLLRAIMFMVVASPCAVVLSTMPALLSAVATAGRNGVLVKGTDVMEALGTVDTVVLDKTGTLTTARPRVAQVTVVGQRLDADAVLAHAAAAEQRSEHVVGRAIVDAARSRRLTLAGVEGFVSRPGRGVEATVDGSRTRVGSQRMIASTVPAVTQAVAGVHARGATAVVVEIDGTAAGVLAIDDQLRHGARAMVHRLAGQSVTSILLTGDVAGSAQRVAAAAGIDQVHAEMLPHDKAAAVARLRAEGRRVAAVGDGVNDAPALASADVGVAIGVGGSDLTIESAGVVLATDRLTRLPAAVALARRANRLVRTNLALALAAIAVLVGLDLSGNLPLVLGVAGHEGSTLLVALNGMRLLRRRAWPAPVACTRRRQAVGWIPTPTVGPHLTRP